MLRPKGLELSSPGRQAGIQSYPAIERRGRGTSLPQPSKFASPPAELWLQDTLDTVGMDDFLDIVWRPRICSMPRPGGPELNSPGRQAGIREADQMSAEGTVLKRGRIIKCRAIGARTLEILIPALRPGLLTDGPTGLDGENQRRGRSKTLSVKCVPQPAHSAAHTCRKAPLGPSPSSMRTTSPEPRRGVAATPRASAHIVIHIYFSSGEYSAFARHVGSTWTVLEKKNGISTM